MCVSCFLFIEFALVNEKKSFLGFGGVCNKMFDHMVKSNFPHDDKYYKY